MNLKPPKVEGRSKRKKYFTLLVIPNNQNALRKWRLPGILIPLLFILSIIGVGSMIFFTYGYFAFQDEVETLKFLRGINDTQATQIKQLQSQAKTLETKLQMVDELDYKVRSLVGLENETDQDLLAGGLQGEGGGLVPLNWQKETVQLIKENEMNGRKKITNTSRGLKQVFQEEIYEVNHIVDNFEELHDQAEMKAIQLEKLLVEVEERLDYLAAIPDYWPLKGRITSPYGWRKNPITKRNTEFHEGLDIAARTGTPVRAAGRGKVVFAGYRSGWGRVLVLDHGNGYQTQYSHNSSILVKVGEQVEKGQNVARVGSSGRSTGSHLDFRIQKNDQFIDPMLLLKE